jgi:oral-facial-digital syndrome 1 protein
VRTNLSLAKNKLTEIAPELRQEHDRSPLKTSELERKAMESLIVDLMASMGYEFSLSVFLPECGLHSKNHCMTRADILQVFDLDARNDINNMATEHSFMLEIFKFLRSKLGSGSLIDTSCQTELDSSHAVYGKLQTLDDQFRLKAEGEEVQTQAALEERMLNYQQECDKLMREELQEQLEVFKRTELEKVRQEEERKYRVELDRLEQHYENEDRTRKERLVQLEEQLTEKIQRDRKHLEQELHKKRQDLLDEFEKLKTREEGLKREIELQKKSLLLEEERLKREQLKASEEFMEAQKLKETASRKIQDEVQRYQLQFDKEHGNLILHLKTEAAKLETQREVHAERERRLNHLDGRLKESERLLYDANIANSNLNATVDKLKEELDSFKQRNYDIKSSNDALQSQLKSSNMEMSQEIIHLKKKLLDLEHRNMSKDQELNAIIKSQAELSKEKTKIKKAGLKWQKEATFLRSNLESQLSLNEQMAARLDAEMLKNKELQKEISDLRLMLHHTQNALQHEFRYGEIKKENLDPSQLNVEDETFLRQIQKLKMEVTENKLTIPDLEVPVMKQLDVKTKEVEQDLEVTVAK